MKIIDESCTEDQTATAVITPSAADYKSCPICGAVCFTDMEVCFGCLHQFDAKDEQCATQTQESVEIFTSEAPQTQTAGSGQDGNSVTAHHVCERQDGQRFEITISIKMLD